MPKLLIVADALAAVADANRAGNRQRLSRATERLLVGSRPTPMNKTLEEAAAHADVVVVGLPARVVMKPLTARRPPQRKVPPPALKVTSRPPVAAGVATVAAVVLNKKTLALTLTPNHRPPPAMVPPPRRRPLPIWRLSRSRRSTLPRRKLRPPRR
jgi:hypothetical protein